MVRGVTQIDPDRLITAVWLRLATRLRDAKLMNKPTHQEHEPKGGSGRI